MHCMSLLITAIVNHLPTCEAEFLVHSECSDVIELDGLIDAMLMRNSSLTRSDIMSCGNLIAETVYELVRDGKYVNAFMGSYYLSASGTLATQTEAFLPEGEGNDHDLRLHHRPYRRIAAMLRLNTKIVRVEHFEKRMAAVWSACSTKDETQGRAFPGEIIRVEGTRLEFDRNDERQGVFFVNGAATRVAEYHVIKNRFIVATVPASLEPGPYTLAVRTMPNGKEISEGRLKDEFTIA